MAHIFTNRMDPGCPDRKDLGQKWDGRLVRDSCVLKSKHRRSLEGMGLRAQRYPRLQMSAIPRSSS